MAVDIVKILIGLEQLYDNPVLKNLRIYLQDPLKDSEIEKSLFFLKVIEDDKNFSNAIKNLVIYMLNPVNASDAEKILPLIKIFSNNENDVAHNLKCYILDPLDPSIAEKLLPLIRIISDHYSSDIVKQIKYTIINNSDILSIFKIFNMAGLTDPLIKNLPKALNSYPDLNWNDAFSKGQLLSKLWLIDELKRLDNDLKLDLNLGVVYVCAGWFGTLPALIFKDGNIKFKYFRSFDIDPSCEAAADTLLKDPYVIDGWKFKAVTKNIYDINYNLENYTILNSKKVPSVTENEVCKTIINTSCDHIAPFSKWWDLIPNGRFVILQNNDSKIDDDHVNNINSLDEMKAQAPMRKIFYEGVLNLPDYNRYMLIGVK